MKLEELEVGQTYSNYDDADYFVTYKTDTFAVVLCYSHNHNMGHLEFMTQKDLDEPWNIELHKDEDWNLGDYFNGYIEYIENDYIKINC